MLRRILIASAAAAMLLVTFTPDDAMLAVAEVAAIGAVAEATAAARSQFEELGAALSLCAAGATAIGVGPIAATAAIAATVSVRRQWAPLRSAPLRRGHYRGGCGYDAYGNWVCPAGTVRTERRDAVGLWCSKPMMKSSA